MLVISLIEPVKWLVLLILPIPFKRYSARLYWVNENLRLCDGVAKVAEWIRRIQHKLLMRDENTCHKVII